MKFKFNSFILFLIACIAVWSCGPKPKEDGEDKDAFNNAEKSLNEEIKGITYNIPPPCEIPYLLQASGAEFIQSLVNDRKKADSYGSQSDKASLNLGAYTSDIGYLSAYDKTQESIDHLNACKNLADKLGVSGSFDPEMLKKFEANIGNKDSLCTLLNDAMKKTDKYLSTDTKSKLGALLVTGSFVESLYISTSIIKSYPANLLPKDKKNLILTPLIQLVINQKRSVGEVIKMISAVEQSGPIPTILADFKTLEASYASLKADEEIKSNKSNLTLTPEMLADVTKVVEKLRSDMVQ